MPRFFAYTRVSTKDQGKKYSLETQSKFLHKVYESLSNKDEYDFVEAKEEKSGKDIENRENLKSILNSLSKKDIIAVYDISRLGRDTQDVLTMLKLIPTKGAVLYIEFTQVNMDSPEEELRRTIDVAIATYQRKVQNIKSRAGIAVKKEMGEWVFRGDLLGYRVNKDEVTVDEEEKAIVQYIFQEYAKAKSIREIANALNKSGVRNRKGTTWYSASVRRFIQKPIYMGFYKLEGAGRAKGQDKVLLNKDGLVKSKLYSPIISESLWWACNNSYRTVKRTHSRQFAYRWSQYELSGILTCGYCHDLGAHKSYVHSHQKRPNLETTWEVYVCRTHIKGCRQTFFTFRAEIAERIFRLSYLVFLSLYQEVEDHFRTIAQEYVEMIEVVDSQITQCENEIQHNDDRIAEIATRFVEATTQALRKALNDRSQQLEDDNNRLRNRVASLQRQRDQVSANRDGDYEDWIETNQEQRIADFLIGSPASRRTVYKEVIKNAFIKNKSLTIEFVNSKRLTMGVTSTRGRKIQREFAIDVYYQDEHQFSLIYDTEDDAYEYVNVVESDDTFKRRAGNIYKGLLDSTFHKIKEIEKARR